MGEYIGVKSYVDVSYSRTVKREALMFDRIAVPYLDLLFAGFEHSKGKLSETDKNLENELRWLVETGIVFNPERFSSNEQQVTDSQYAKYKRWEKEVLDEMVELNIKHHVDTSDKSIMARAIYAAHLNTRYTAIQLREVNKADAFPVYYIPTFPEEISSAGKNEVVQIVLNSLPVPDESTAWERILDYRDDPASREKFLDLRNWMNEIARADLPPVEIEQKLEYLLSQYKRHMELHKMKTNAGTLETIVVTTGEIFEDLAHFNFGKVAKTLFSFKHRQIALLEGELTSSGSEVAYVMKAKQAFPEVVKR